MLTVVDLPQENHLWPGDIASFCGNNPKFQHLLNTNKSSYSGKYICVQESLCGHFILLSCKHIWESCGSDLLTFREENMIYRKKYLSCWVTGMIWTLRWGWGGLLLPPSPPYCCGGSSQTCRGVNKQWANNGDTYYTASLIGKPV